MYYAKSMYQGGTIISAESMEIDYFTYLIGGLCCLVCGEPVHFRNGEYKKAYFAHFKSTNPSPSCILRVTGYSLGLSSLTPEGKGQRRDLFEKSFLKIIKLSHPKLEINLQLIHNNIKSQILKDITVECCQYFYNNHSKLALQCRSLNQSSYDSKLVLNKIIASEAVAYLSVKSSRHLLEILIHYSIDKYFNFNPLNLDSLVNKINPANICQILTQTLIDTSWLLNLSNRWQDTKLKTTKETTNNSQTDHLLKELRKFICIDPDKYYFNITDLKSRSQKTDYFRRLEIVEIRLEGNIINLMHPDYKNCRISTFAQITDCRTELENQLIIDWIFVNYDCAGFQPHDYITFYAKLKRVINDFLKKQINPTTQNRFIVSCNFVGERRLKEVKEAEERRLKEVKEVEERRLKEAEERRLKIKEAEERYLKEAEERHLKEKEAEGCHLTEAEKCRLKEAEERRLKEAEERRLKKKEAKDSRRLKKKEVEDKLKEAYIKGEEEFKKELQKYLSISHNIMVDCPGCQNKIKREKLISHLKKVHFKII